MSPLDSTENQGPKQFNLVTAMLAVALVMIVIATVLLAVELNRYNWDIDAKSAALPASQMPRSAPQADWLA